MTFERFFTKIPNFILIGQKKFGHHRQFFFLIEALNIFYTETASQIKVDVCWIFKKKKFLNTLQQMTCHMKILFIMQDNKFYIYFKMLGYL